MTIVLWCEEFIIQEVRPGSLTDAVLHAELSEVP